MGNFGDWLESFMQHGHGPPLGLGIPGWRVVDYGYRDQWPVPRSCGYAVGFEMSNAVRIPVLKYR